MLLASIDLETAAYTIRVTDMANMWIESLDRKAICMRGWGENTSIDPSDTPENMAKLLAIIRSALDPSQPDYDQTSMSLSTATMSDAGEGGLTLKLTCSLPGLHPLKWPIHLKKAPSSSIATSLVLPLIEAQYSRAREVDSLTDLLSHKDTVIGRLLDKLEATGTGLEHVFNVLSGKKKTTRALAGNKVKGLASFEKTKWKSDMADLENGPNNPSSLVREVFGNGVEYSGTLDFEESPALDRWWRDFKGTLQISHCTHSTRAQDKNRIPSPATRATADEADEDDFEVQLTPLHLASKEKRRAISKAPSANYELTDSGDDASVSKTAAQKSPFEKCPHKPKPKPKGTEWRQGAIGAKNQATPQSSHTLSSEFTTEKVANAAADGSDTASDVDYGDSTASIPNSSLPPPPPKQSVLAKWKLGRIGGRGTAAQVTQKYEASHEETPNEDPASSSRSHRIGMIGKGVKTGVSTTSDDDGTTARGRQSVKEKSEVKGAPRETSTERADRRREELKREIEKKAAADPAKKKRRF